MLKLNPNTTMYTKTETQQNNETECSIQNQRINSYNQSEKNIILVTGFEIALQKGIMSE